MSKIYCGIDFHKRTCTLVMKNSSGENLEGVITVHTKRLVQYLSNRKNLMIGIEASGGTNHMVEMLKESGHDVRIINPVKFRAVGLGGKKTDERDAETIADYLRANFIPEVHHKSKVSREMKSLIVMREHLVKKRVDSVNHIRGILREYGITMKTGFENFQKEIRPSLEKLENKLIAENLRTLLEIANDLLAQENSLTQQIEDMAKESVKVKALKSIPGIGVLGATICVSVIDDISRFKNAKAFASYIGLVPSENSSGDKKRLGSITRSGCEIMRRYFIHGARAILTSPSRKMQSDPIVKWARKIEARKGRNKATVALAHKLSRIAFAVLKDEGEYSTKPIKQIQRDLLKKAS